MFIHSFNGKIAISSVPQLRDATCVSGVDVLSADDCNLLPIDGVDWEMSISDVIAHTYFPLKYSTSGYNYFSMSNI